MKIEPSDLWLTVHTPPKPLLSAHLVKHTDGASMCRVHRLKSSQNVEKKKEGSSPLGAMRDDTTVYRFY